VEELLKGLGSGDAKTDGDQRTIRLTVGSDGPASQLESVRRLDGSDVALADIALHRPTLDDVFLSLTGRVAEEAAEPETAAQERRGRRGRRGKQKEEA
jgi:ABC-2 type transport system ATP-binding protein